tara:strand:+ start:16 stop:393 length:378 start_codon:yes stop_codon:yes gene_type:complete
MKKTVLSVCMLLFSVSSFASFKTLKIDLDHTFGSKEFDTELPVELSSNKDVEIISDYMNISQKYSMTDRSKKTFIIAHPNKNVQKTLLVKYGSGEITKLKLNFISKNKNEACSFKLTYQANPNCN